MKDPVRLRTTRLRDRPLIYMLCILVGVSVVATAILVWRVSRIPNDRIHQLQDVICGVYVPIAGAPLPPKSSELARTIVAATRHGAVSIHCPGVK